MKSMMLLTLFVFAFFTFFTINVAYHFTETANYLANEIFLSPSQNLQEKNISAETSVEENEQRIESAQNFILSPGMRALAISFAAFMIVIFVLAIFLVFLRVKNEPAQNVGTDGTTMALLSF